MRASEAIKHLIGSIELISTQGRRPISVVSKDLEATVVASSLYEKLVKEELVADVAREMKNQAGKKLMFLGVEEHCPYEIVKPVVNQIEKTLKDIARK